MKPGTTTQPATGSSSNNNNSFIDLSIGSSALELLLKLRTNLSDYDCDVTHVQGMQLIMGRPGAEAGVVDKVTPVRASRDITVVVTHAAVHWNRFSSCSR